MKTRRVDFHFNDAAAGVRLLTGHPITGPYEESVIHGKGYHSGA